MPVLNKTPVSYEELQVSLGKWLSRFKAVHVVADWPEDIQHFCNALITGPGERLDAPLLTMEVVRIDSTTALPHNGLADARGIRDAFIRHHN